MPSHKIVRSTVHGTFALSLGVIVNLVAQFSTVPIALAYWGKIRYGEWIVLTGFVLFLKTADLGLQTYVINRLRAAYVLNDKNGFVQVLKNAVMLQTMLAITVLIAFAAALYSPIDWLMRLNLTTLSQRQFELTAWVLGLELLLLLPMGVIAGIYRATGLLPRAAVIGAFQQFMLLASMLSCIALDSDFLAVAVARVCVVALFSLYIISDLKRLHPWLRAADVAFQTREALGLLVPSILFLLVPLADYMSNQAILIIIQKHLGPTEVTNYVTHRTVVNCSQLLATTVATAIWPEITALYARAEHGLLQTAHRLFTKATACIVGLTLFAVIALCDWVYPLWTLKQLVLDGLLLATLSVRMIFWSMWSASITVLSATNSHQTIGLVLLSSGLIGAILAAVLVPSVGIVGAAFGGTIGELLVANWLIPMLAVKVTGDSFGEMMGELYAFVIPGVLLPLILAAVAQYAPVSTMWKMAGWVAALTVFVRFTWFRLHVSERRTITETISVLLKRSKA